MDFDDYQAQTEETAIYPEDFPEFLDAGQVYTAMGLSDEAGEVLGKVKKALREDDPEYMEEAVKEAGDVLWYLARFLAECDESLNETANANLAKLLDRQERGKLEGEGDTR